MGNDPCIATSKRKVSDVGKLEFSANMKVGLGKLETTSSVKSDVGSLETASSIKASSRGIEASASLDTHIKDGRLMGLIADIQHYSIQDGPGIRTTVFLKGCPLHCPWCHNPEMIDRKRTLWYNDRTCTRCGRCIEMCPEKAISGFGGERRIDRDRCVANSGCSICVDACLPKANEIVGQWLDIDTVMKEVLKDKSFYQRSGGGTCISGGEPLLQPDFTLEFLKRCHREVIDTAIETCCNISWDILGAAAEYADYMLTDIKNMDSAKHREATGAGNELILENIAKLSAMGKKIRIRTPIIPGYNDSEENLRKQAEFMVKNNLPNIDLLAYHSTGSFKYEKLGQPYLCADIHEPTAAEMSEHFELFKSYGIGGTIGGSDIEPD